MKKINQLKTEEEVINYYKEQEEKLKKAFGNLVFSCVVDVQRLRDKCANKLRSIKNES